MLRLLKIELIKTINNRTVWIIFGLHFLLLAPIAFGFQGLLNNTSLDFNGFDVGEAIVGGFKVFDYPFIWHNLSYLASWFKLFLAMIIIINVTNEYQFRTLKQNIIDGMSKWEALISKELLILILSLISVLFIAVLTLILGKKDSDISILTGSAYLLRYFISLILYLNIAYLLGTLIKRSGLSIALLLIYSLIIENLIGFQLPQSISNLLPINLIENLIPNPMMQFLGAGIVDSFDQPGLLLSFIYLVICVFLVFMNLKNSRF